MTRALLASVAGLFMCGCAGVAPTSAGRPSTVAFLSDFGLQDDAVGLCWGEVLRAAGDGPTPVCVDLDHQVTPYSVEHAADLLAGAAPHFPAGTVFLCVVDPGVGSRRRAVAARTRSGQLYVGPDNGLLTLLEQTDGLAEVREIANPDWMSGRRHSSTFHGRDVFSPVAGRLAVGRPLEQVGPLVPIESLVRLKLTAPRLDADGLAGQVILLDGPYGNLRTNITAEQFESLGWRLGDAVPVQLGERSMTLPLCRTFSDVSEGKPLLFVDSRGRVGLAVNLGDFAKTYRVAPPTPIRILAKK